MRLSKDQKENHMPEICPYCGEWLIQEMEKRWRGRTMELVYECVGCREQWRETWVLKSVGGVIK